MTTSSGSQGFEGASFFRTSFKGATLRSCDVSGVTMRSVDVGGLDIDSHDLFFGSLVVRPSRALAPSSRRHRSTDSGSPSIRAGSSGGRQLASR
jgi:hypothetical protein